MYEESKEEDIKMLSMSIQSLIHLLAIGGINLPIHHCCKTGESIIPPLGNWEWRCYYCLLYTSPSPRDRTRSRMPSSA